MVSAVAEELAGLAAMRRAYGEHRKEDGTTADEKKVAPRKDSSDTNDGTTRRLYLESSYVFEVATEVVRASATEVVLAATVFHPQGGGQPSDRGVVEVGDGTFFVSSVEAKSRDAGEIVHVGTWDTRVPVERGSAATARIDAKHRELCARLHSAGHAIDVAVDRAGYDVVPAKGYHFPDGNAYVEYQGKVADTAAFVAALNDHLLAIVAADEPTRVDTDPSSGDRIVAVAGKPIPCGGTHVRSTAQLGAVTVTKAKHKSGKLRVSYVLADESSS
mmetsp:Transcript_6019/g.18903  ORF Transcript_6019/g.18903 Transcript_6019/m.18903 type:complete len:274 (+) Transcript_6019:98-919(+)